jgi:thiol-disulfide isomerase/thioredoxin
MPVRRTRRTAARTAAVTVAIAALALALSACSTSGDNATGNNGYVSGDGTITVIDPADREKAPTLQGDKLGGGTLDTADYAGKTVVINVWGSWCGECRTEAEGLVEASKVLADKTDDQVAFVGLNTRDPSEAPALSYVREFDVPYPSLVDQDSKLLLNFYGIISPRAIPSTLVIDAEGRLAAVVSGPTTADTLVDLVEDVSVS